MKTFRMFILILLTSSPLAAAPWIGPLTDISRATLWGGAGFDLGTTAYGLHNNPNLREANPFLRNRKAAEIAVAGAGITTLFDFACVKLRMPRLAVAIRFAVGGAHVVAGIHNIKIGGSR